MRTIANFHVSTIGQQQQQQQPMWIMNIVMNFERPLCPLHLHVIPRMQYNFFLFAPHKFSSSSCAFSLSLLLFTALQSAFCASVVCTCTGNSVRITCSTVLIYQRIAHIHSKHHKKCLALTTDALLPRGKKTTSIYIFMMLCYVLLHESIPFTADSILSTVEFEGSFSFQHSLCARIHITHPKTKNRNEIFDERIVSLTREPVNQLNGNADPPVGNKRTQLEPEQANRIINIEAISRQIDIHLKFTFTLEKKRTESSITKKTKKNNGMNFINN